MQRAQQRENLDPARALNLISIGIIRPANESSPSKTTKPRLCALKRNDRIGCIYIYLYTSDRRQIHDNRVNSRSASRTRERASGVRALCARKRRSYIELLSLSLSLSRKLVLTKPRVYRAPVIRDLWASVRRCRWSLTGFTAPRLGCCVCVCVCVCDARVHARGRARKSRLSKGLRRERVLEFFLMVDIGRRGV